MKDFLGKVATATFWTLIGIACLPLFAIVGLGKIEEAFNRKFPHGMPKRAADESWFRWVGMSALYILGIAFFLGFVVLFTFSSRD